MPYPDADTRIKLGYLYRQKPTTNLLAAFSVLPPKIKFETQREDEQILLFLRRHPITNFTWIFASSVLILIPLIIPFDWFMQSLPFAVPSSLSAVATAFWYLAITGYVILHFLYWYFNVGIVTNKRIVDVDFQGLLIKEVSETVTDKIEDVTSQMGGIFRDLFNYGDVLIQTAGEIDRVEFIAVPRPTDVVRIISTLMGKNK